jgi:hypothetical protein
MKNGQVWLLLLFIQIYEPLTRNPLDGQREFVLLIQAGI